MCAILLPSSPLFFAKHHAHYIPKHKGLHCLAFFLVHFEDFRAAHGLELAYAFLAYSGALAPH